MERLGIGLGGLWGGIGWRRGWFRGGLACWYWCDVLSYFAGWRKIRWLSILMPLSCWIALSSFLVFESFTKANLNRQLGLMFWVRWMLRSGVKPWKRVSRSLVLKCKGRLVMKMVWDATGVGFLFRRLTLVQAWKFPLNSSSRCSLSLSLYLSLSFSFPFL